MDNPIKAILIERKWTPVQLAMVLGVGSEEIRRYLTGEPKSIRPRFARAIAQRLEINPGPVMLDYLAWRREQGDAIMKH